MRRNSAEVRVRTGFRSDGTITFREIDADYLLGAYADISDRVVGKGSYTGCGPYRVPAARIVARSVLSHTPPSTAFRGFGTPQVALGGRVEPGRGGPAARDRPSGAAAAQPARRGEAVHPRRPACRRAVGAGGQEGGRADRLGQPAAGRPRPRHRRSASSQDRRPAFPTRPSGCSRTAASIMSAGTSDMGQGARTVFTQIAAEELGVPVDRITLVMGDTAPCPTTSRPRPAGRRC